MMTEPTISVCVPAFNEADNLKRSIPTLIDALQKTTTTFEILIVNDGSHDATFESVSILQKQFPQIHYLEHRINKGYGGALQTAMNHARMEWVLIADADAQFDYQNLPSIIRHCQHYDFLAGFRPLRQDNLYRIMLSKIGNRCASIYLKHNVADVGCAFKLIRTSLIQHMHFTSHGAVFNTELFKEAIRLNARMHQFPVTHFKRISGRQTGGSLKVVARSCVDFMRLCVGKSGK